ncbi:MAG: hypothetical protein J6T74_00210 [Clostridia bacterium]|nr:hypothetical protein [Clostridia bacterium]
MSEILVKHHEPIVYRVYEYLKENHLGKENGIKREDLALKLNIPMRALRKITSEINSSSELEKLISTTNCCYMCKTESECESATQSTFRQAFSLLKKAYKMEKSAAEMEESRKRFDNMNNGK